MSEQRILGPNGLRAGDASPGVAQVRKRTAAPAARTATVFGDSIPLSLYVHFPWCPRKCPYCDFNSHPGQPDRQMEEAYVEALLSDLHLELPMVADRSLESIFLGGGTPSLFSPRSIDRLLSAIREHMPTRADCEITLEANPGTVDARRFGGYREAGVNRLSIGVQSFSDRLLKRLGRIHDGAAATSAAESARKSGFDNFNLDLMYGLPGQTLEEATRDIDLACELGPTHLSHYQLTLEPNTEYAVRPPKLPDDDLMADMALACSGRLRLAGYRRYEVSAYARGRSQCHHNLNYWRFGDYLGIGAGAHSKLTDLTAGQVLRRARIRQPKRFLATAGTEAAVASTRLLESGDLLLEFAINALRLEEGFGETLFEQRTGLAANSLEPGLRKGSEQGLLAWENGHVRATALGRRFLNDAILLFAESAPN